MGTSVLVIQHLRTQESSGEARAQCGESLVLGDRTHVLEVIPSVRRKARDFTQAATLALRFQGETDKVKRMPFQAKGTAHTRQTGQSA